MLHDLPTVNLKIGPNRYKLKVATTQNEKNRGLSGVDDLEGCDGMLFPYDDEKPRRFTFKDTLIPLKVYFIGSSGKVVQKSFSKPGQKEDIMCKTPCMWVVEVENI